MMKSASTSKGRSRKPGKKGKSSAEANIVKGMVEDSDFSLHFIQQLSIEANLPPNYEKFLARAHLIDAAYGFLHSQHIDLTTSNLIKMTNTLSPTANVNGLICLFVITSLRHSTSGIYRGSPEACWDRSCKNPLHTPRDLHFHREE